MKKNLIILFSLLTLIIVTGCSVSVSSTNANNENESLIGAWKGRVQFNSGAFESIKDLEFLYVFNEGGTMTESSNYDEAPPVTPAYGVWRKTGSGQYEAKYEFYWTKAPANFEEIANGSGWLPGGYGVLMEKIILSDDGNSFHSTIKYDAFDQNGNPVEGGGEAEVIASRIDF